MKPITNRIRAFLQFLLFAVTAIGISAAPSTATTYKFGVVPQFEPRELANIWVPILEELHERTGLDFEMVGSANIPDFEIGFEHGEFDFAYMNPYHSMVAARKQSYVPIVRDGGRELFGVLVVREDSPITKVEELAGTKIAFPAPNALGASLLMRADLDSIHHISFRPIYAQTHSSSYLNVVLGVASAGGGVMATLNRQDPEVKESLRVLYETRRMPPHPVMVHPRVKAADMQAVQKAFLEMGQTEEGAALLARVPIKKIIKASAAEYEVLGTWGLENYYVSSE